MAAAARHFGHGITRKSWRDRKAAQKAKPCPHLLQVVRAKSTCAMSEVLFALPWPAPCAADPWRVSAGLDEVLLLLLPELLDTKHDGSAPSTLPSRPCCAPWLLCPFMCSLLDCSGDIRLASSVLVVVALLTVCW